MKNANILEQENHEFGLIAQVGTKRIALPLKLVECDFSVAAGVVEVQMTQVFRQENSKPLDCVYLFPLPSDASVYSCEADMNGRIIRATVKERKEAVKLAEEKKAEGRRVALVESERANLFTLNLSNLQPDDLILVTLKYLQPLRHLADMTSVEIPFCPGIRYIPGNPLIRSNRGTGTADDTDQVPDASRISPVRIDGEHTDAAFIHIQGKLDGCLIDAKSLTSPSHDIISESTADDLRVKLSQKSAVPDRDFVVRWKEKNPETLLAQAWHSDREGKTYSLIEIRAPKAVGEAVPMDFYFLVDRSGSMAGTKWEKAVEAVQASVKNLGEQDRVMITLFDSQSYDFSEAPMAPQKILKDKKFQKLVDMSVDGGTEMLPALKHVVQLAETHSKDRYKSVILITDAEVGNDTEILKALRPAADLPIHCFGIDNNLNDALLRDLARQQNGTFNSLNPDEDVAKIISDMALTIRHPVLKGLTLSVGWETAFASLPPLYSGQVYHASACSTGKHPLILTGSDDRNQPVQIQAAEQPAANASPYLNWCKQSIERCISENREQDAIALSVESNLICPLTAFIAWDEQEKVSVATHLLMQPSVNLDCRMIQMSPPRFRSIRAFRAPSAKLPASYNQSPRSGSPPPATALPLNMWRATLLEKIKSIVEACRLPELDALCRAILDWVFQSKTGVKNRLKLANDAFFQMGLKTQALDMHFKNARALEKELENKISLLDEVRHRLKEHVNRGRCLTQADIQIIKASGNATDLQVDDLMQLDVLRQKILSLAQEFVNLNVATRKENPPENVANSIP